MMNKYKDKMGMFKDYNFKLVVIDALLDKEPAFIDELEEMKEKYCKPFELYKDESPIEEMAKYFAQLKLEEADLNKITELCFDGGNEIYFYICPDWDGEDDCFDIHSIEGYKNLKNLKTVTYISMIEEDILKSMKNDGIEIC
jgi:hypothetical protein